jgi:hypothetical protein
MTPLLQLTAKLMMVEHFTIGGKDNLTILVRQRLRSAISIESSELDVGQTDALAGIEPVTFGAAMPDGRCHTAK